jgi:hypothetical protein
MTTTTMERKTVSVGVAATTNSTRRPYRATGEAVAALLAAGTGLLVLALVNQIAELSDPFANWLHGIGKIWMPGAPGIGPYSGKETMALVGWLVSWAILHPVLRGREMKMSRWLVVFLVMVAVATTFIWPPVYTHFAH